MRKDKVKADIADAIRLVDQINRSTLADCRAALESILAVMGEGQAPKYATAYIRGYAMRKFAERFPSVDATQPGDLSA